MQHLVSRVRGELRDGLDALHAYRAAANMGTLTGAPKPRAMEIVRTLETDARGYYGGAVGYLLQDGSLAQTTPAPARARAIPLATRTERIAMQVSIVPSWRR